jgi:UPF0755 protein
MFKRILVWFLLVVFISAIIAAWKIFGPATTFSDKSTMIYIPTGKANRETVEQIFSDGSILRSPATFNLVANQMGYWKKIKPGRYEIKKGMNVLNVVRMLRNGKQAPVNLVINKFRTKEDFARYAGKMLECDSTSIMEFFMSNDSLKKYDLDSNTVMTAVVPNTYTMYWNISAARLFERMFDEQQRFWTEERKTKAAGIGLDPKQVYTLASIVEEETNKNDEKPLIASVYINRLKKGMRFSADPTVKYALRDFEIKRILLKHIDASATSPYNTYRQAGLPPGPICTPSIKSIDGVLDATPTDYLFFCAKPDFSGYHVFASNDRQHMENAKAYQRALDSLLIK